MPDFVTAANTIRSLFAAGFTAYPVAWENVAFDPPRDGSGAALPFVRFSMLEGDASAVSIGEKITYRHPGVVKINIFVPTQAGDASARAIGDLVAAVFRGVGSNGVRFFSASYRSNGISGAYWQATVTVRFEHDLVA